MSKSAIAITIGSTLLVIALSFLIICTVSFWKMKTQKDTSYQDGFNDGLTEKAELELSVAELRRTNSELTTQLTTITNTVSANERTISELRTSKTALEEQVATLTADNEANSLEITRLTALKTSYETQINNLSEQNAEKQATITQLVADKSALNTQITALQNENAQNEQTISSLQDELENSQGNNVALQTQIATLQARINQNNLQIAELQSSRAELENRVLDLNDSISTNVSTINSLNGQITSLNAQITNLTSANNSNVNTIASLNSQVSVLTNRINELSYTNVEQSNRIVYLNAQIAKLNDYISKYDQFLTGFESETQAIATFELDGSLYNIQLVTNGGYANVDSPANTQYLIFNGWTVNNTIVNLSTYAITQNTKFIADVTHKYDVSFVVDSDVINTQIIAKNGHATAPANPIKSGYTFLGWTINGTTVVDPASVSITDTTTFTALFTQQFTVNFVYDNNTVSTQSVDKGSYGTAPVINSTTYMIFNGWTINGGLVDVAIYPITQNTTFVADITYKYDVTFVVDNETVNSQIIVKNGYASVPTAPTKANYEFDGWTIDGTTIVNPLNIAITANTVFTAKFTRLYNVTFTYEETTESAQVVRNGNYANNVTVNSTTYKVFNGWKLNDVIVDVSATPITADTNFVADITYKYDVIFKVDDEIVNSQIVVINSCAVVPTAPTKTDYEFDGWSIDGITIVNPITTPIIANTIFTAKFTRLYNVTFTYEGTTESTQVVRNGNYANNITVNSTTYKIFNGWKLNGIIVDVSATPITADTNFVADITYKYDVIFKVDDEIVNSQVIVENSYATTPSDPIKTAYVFDGWTLDGDIVVDVSTINIIVNTIFIAKFHQLTFANASWSEIATVSNDIKTNNLTAAQVASKYGWHIGDRKKFTLQDDSLINIVILGYNHDDISGNGGKAGISLGMTNCLKTYYKMNQTNTNVGGWDSSDMRLSTMEYLFTLLPSELQSVIKTVDKKSSAGDRSANIITSSDKLWLFSQVEVEGTTADILKNEGSQYAYWASVKDGTVAANRIVPGISSSGCDWVLRSAKTNSNTTFLGYVGSSGNSNTNMGTLANNSYAVRFGFCI